MHVFKQYYYMQCVNYFQLQNTNETAKMEKAPSNIK